MRQELRCGLTMSLLVAACAVSAVAKKAPKVPPDPKFAAIGNISLIPIVDARAGDKAGVNLEKLQNQAVTVLKNKHYHASSASESGDAKAIAVEDLEQAAPAFIRKLGPADSRWVLVVCLDDIASKITFGSTGNAEVSGYLFDKDSAGLVWKGKGVGQAGQGGLAGMAMKGMMKSEALAAAIGNLFGTMPNLPKPGK